MTRSRAVRRPARYGCTHRAHGSAKHPRGQSLGGLPIALQLSARSHAASVMTEWNVLFCVQDIDPAPEDLGGVRLTAHEGAGGGRRSTAVTQPVDDFGRVGRGAVPGDAHHFGPHRHVLRCPPLGVAEPSTHPGTSPVGRRHMSHTSTPKQMPQLVHHGSDPHRGRGRGSPPPGGRSLGHCHSSALQQGPQLSSGLQADPKAGQSPHERAAWLLCPSSSHCGSNGGRLERGDPYTPTALFDRREGRDQTG